MTDGTKAAKRGRVARHWRTALGVVLFVAGVVVTGWMTLRASSTEPPGELATLAIFSLGTIFQLVSLFIFNSIGRPDPSLARAAVRRLILLTGSARRTKEEAEAASFGSPTEAKAAIGRISVALSFIEEGVASSALDWVEFQPDATRKLEETDQ